MPKPHFVNQSDTVLAQRARCVAEHLAEVAGSGSPNPVTARDLADVCGIGGSVQTQRKMIRDVVRFCRETGGRQICASTGIGDAEAGYWLARNHNEWAAYKESRKNHAVFAFVATARMDRAVTERRSGQGTLFEAKPIAAFR